ncbi:MAG: siroheme synthase CysG, partial [Gammaproteobacteria bacterium]|nr:siroheme synthase CysG [Gammaproteobacteria bacterium]
MRYLPLLFDLRGKPCLLVGGGEVALRKAKFLLKAGAALSVVAPDICPDLEALLQRFDAAVLRQAFEAELVAKQQLVVAATNDKAVNELVANRCRELGVLVNTVDAPDHCDVIFPAIVDRDPVLVAVSSSATAPVLARKIRADIESSTPANIGALAAFIDQRRALVRRELDESAVRLFWESVVESEVAERVMAGHLDSAEQLFEEKLRAACEQGQCGEVYLIGAGPGDPDLLTFKALRLLQRADVVLYDRLVSDAIIAMARRDADLVYVGKARSDHSVPQPQINQMLLDYASQGKKVARLKGGDPFVFGRGGEEIAGLSAAKIPFQVVPGITAANGCACYAGIPLTHRDYAHSVRFITGHLKAEANEHDWKQLVDPAQTLVIYMGLLGLENICKQLVAHGAAPELPVALI